MSERVIGAPVEENNLSAAVVLSVGTQQFQPLEVLLSL